MGEAVMPNPHVRKVTEFLETRRIWSCVKKGTADCECYICKQFRDAIELLSTQADAIDRAITLLSALSTSSRPGLEVERTDE